LKPLLFLLDRVAKKYFILKYITRAVALLAGSRRVLCSTYLEAPSLSLIEMIRY